MRAKLFFWFRLIFLVGIVGLVVFLCWIFYSQNWQLQDIDRSNIPQFIQADFIDTSKVQQISKYRSAVGHDFSFGGEKCRSMRHYFGFDRPNVQKEKDSKAYLYDTFSPVDGKIMSIDGSKEYGYGVDIKPDNAPRFIVRIDNLIVDPKISVFSKVKAGQKIGNSRGMAEISIFYNYFRQFRGFSYFEVMPDSLFARYQAAAGKSLTRQDFIISKEYRDSHPLQCDNTEAGNFLPSRETENEMVNYVFLNGYVPSKKF